MTLKAARRILICTTLLGTACNSTAGDDADALATARTDSLTGVSADSVYSHADHEALPSNRIYYTLTDHAWYARGEPLRHDGSEYAPAGRLISAPLAEMERIGEYDGVEFYARRDETERVVYVPVFQGYWQAFRAPGTARRGD